MANAWNLLTTLAMRSWNLGFIEFKLVYLIFIGVITGIMSIIIHGHITINNTENNYNIPTGGSNEVKNKEKFIRQKSAQAKSSSQYKSGSFSGR